MESSTLFLGHNLPSNRFLDIGVILTQSINKVRKEFSGKLNGKIILLGKEPKKKSLLDTIEFRYSKKQLKEKTGNELPTHVVACVGGGSNAAGAFYHFLNEPSVNLVAVEAAGHGVNSGLSAATTQLGTPGILHGSKSIVMQTSDGQVVEPHSISAGLDYPGIGPLHAFLYESKRGIFLSATDEEALESAFHLSKIEGIIPALETAHAFSVLPKMNLKASDVVRYIAEDIFQETFIKVIKTLKKRQYNEEGKFLPWVIRIARNLIIDHFRRIKKMPPMPVYINEEGEEISAFNTIASENNETSNEENYMLKKNIRNLITELPSDQREVLIMRMYYDMSFKEISEFTKVSINTSLGRMRYALLNLKKLINERKMEIVY